MVVSNFILVLKQPAMFQRVTQNGLIFQGALIKHIKVPYIYIVLYYYYTLVIAVQGSRCGGLRLTLGLPKRGAPPTKLLFSFLGVSRVGPE